MGRDYPGDCLDVHALLSITRKLLDACERQTHPHIEEFCKERARKALADAAKEIE